MKASVLETSVSHMAFAQDISSLNNHPQKVEIKKRSVINPFNPTKVNSLQVL